MPHKRIIIVDDEEAILIVLKNSLKKLGPDYEVTTAPDGPTAVQLMQHIEFDLLVTDYRMVGMNGLELIAAARLRQPKIQVVLMTAYGSPTLEEDLKDYQPYQYLNKPLEIDAFRQVVQKTLSASGEERPPILVFSDSTYRQVHELLTGLRTDSGARCIFLTNAEGNLVAQVGDSRELPLEQIATLVGGGIAALFEAGRVLDGGAEAIHFTFREGSQENLYAVNVGREWLLTVITENGPYTSKLGSVWYYTRQVAVSLRSLLTTANLVEVSLGEAGNLDTALDEEFDTLFGAELPVKVPTADHPVAPKGPALPESIAWEFEHAGLSAAQADEPAPREEPPPQPSPEPKQAGHAEERLLSFDEAIKAGLIQWPTIDGSIL